MAVTKLREFADERGKTKLRDLATEKSTMRGKPSDQGFDYLGHFKTGRARTIIVKEK